MADQEDIQRILRPFNQRASEAEVCTISNPRPRFPAPGKLARREFNGFVWPTGTFARFPAHDLTATLDWKLNFSEHLSFWLQERLAKLEAALGSGKGSLVIGQEELLTCLTELRSKLEKARAEQISEREKAIKEQEKLATENAKLQYRITHLVRALKEADKKLELKST